MLVDGLEVDLLEGVTGEHDLFEFMPLYEAAGGAVNDKKAFVLRNVLFLGTHSKNGREYSKRAQESYVRKAEGGAVYMNHRAKTQKMRHTGDYAGISRDLHVTESGGVRGDWHYYKKVQEDIEDAMRLESPHVGMSLDGRGRLRGRGRGQPALVEDYLVHNSTDFVMNPATTGGLHESIGDAVPPADDALLEEENDMSKELQEQVEKLTKQLSERDETDAKTSKVLDAITKELAEAKTKVEDAEKEKAKAALVTEAITESKKTVSAVMHNAVMLFDTKEQMLAFLKELPDAKKGSTGPMTQTTSADPITEDATKKRAETRSTEMKERVKNFGYEAGCSLDEVIVPMTTKKNLEKKEA